MANKDAAFGLRPLRSIGSTAHSGGINKYYIPATYETALFVGDPVVRSGTTNTAQVDGRYAVGELPGITKSAAGDASAITGVIVGFEADPDNRTRIHNPADTERVALVLDNPATEFEIQADGTVAVTEIGLNAVLIFTNAGSTSTGLSGVELDTTCDAPAADASNQLTIMRYSADPENNDTTAANVNLVVKINLHTESHGTGALGI